MGAEAAKSTEAADLERLVDLSPDLLCTTKMDGSFVRLNPAWSLTLGYPESELVGRRFMELVHPDDRKATLVVSRGLLKPGHEVSNFENRVVHRDGSHRWLSWSARSDGRRGYAVAHDITERRTAERALRRSEARYRSIIETTSEGVWMIDANHRTTYVNPRMAEMIGYEVDEMLGRPVVDFTPPHRHPGVRRHIQSRRAGAADQREELLRHKDGSDVWVLLAGSPLTDSGGGYAGALAMMADITERKRAEARAAKLAGIVEASPDAIVSLSLDGVIETFNAAAERQSGWTADEVVGKPVTLMVPPENEALIAPLLAEVGGGSRIERIRGELIDKHGRREEASLSLAPIPTPSGRVAGIACVIRATVGE